MSNMHNGLDSLPTQLKLWQAEPDPVMANASTAPASPSNAGAWPTGTLTELRHSQAGGELSTVLPELARLSQAGRWLAWIAPPHLPLAPSLAAGGVNLSRILLVHPRAGGDGLRTVEQALRAGTCGAVLAWPAALDEAALQRLREAAAASRAWCILFRAELGADSPISLALRQGGEAARH